MVVRKEVETENARGVGTERTRKARTERTEVVRTEKSKEVERKGKEEDIADIIPTGFGVAKPQARLEVELPNSVIKK